MLGETWAARLEDTVVMLERASSVTPLVGLTAKG